jgi:hypothetical protein
MDSLLSLILDLLKELFRIGRPRREIREFALARGFEYARKMDPAQLDLYATSFFGRFDVARDVITGVLDKTKFIYFDHDRASGRGDKALMRSVVTFEVSAKTGDCSPTSASDGWMFEKSGTHLFLWRWNDKQPKPTQEIEAFLNSALKVSERLLRPASSNYS